MEDVCARVACEVEAYSDMILTLGSYVPAIVGLLSLRCSHKLFLCVSHIAAAQTVAWRWQLIPKHLPPCLCARRTVSQRDIHQWLPFLLQAAGGFI